MSNAHRLANCHDEKWVHSCDKLLVVDVAQGLEHQVVALGVGGSIPLIHPILCSETPYRLASHLLVTETLDAHRFTWRACEAGRVENVSNLPILWGYVL